MGGDQHDTMADVQGGAGLSPFDGLPSQNVQAHAVVLMVGIVGVGKKSLAAGWNTDASSLAIQFRIAEKLPLAQKADRPRIDYILFMIDVTNRASFEVVKASLRSADPGFLHGRCCVLITRMDKPMVASVAADELDALLEEYDVPAFYGNLSCPTDTRVVSDRLTAAIRVACGYGGATHAVLSTMIASLTPNNLFE